MSLTKLGPALSPSPIFNLCILPSFLYEIDLTGVMIAAVPAAAHSLKAPLTTSSNATGLCSTFHLKTVSARPIMDLVVMEARMESLLGTTSVTSLPLAVMKRQLLVENSSTMVFDFESTVDSKTAMSYNLVDVDALTMHRHSVALFFRHCCPFENGAF